MKKYLRFGPVPAWGERSIKFNELNFDQREDISDIIKDGKAAELPQLLQWLVDNCRSWRRVDLSAIFENGVSAFEMDADGLPIINNSELAMSLKIRLEEPAYILTGDENGRGEDGEPLLVNVTAEPITINKSALSAILEKWALPL